MHDVVMKGVTCYKDESEHDWVLHNHTWKNRGCFSHQSFHPIVQKVHWSSYFRVFTLERRLLTGGAFVLGQELLPKYDYAIQVDNDYYMYKLEALDLHLILIIVSIIL